MAAITAALVNELRNKTGLGMMECKKMLTETNGDVDAAIEAFRKKGVKTSIMERVATEGRVQVAVNADKTRGAVVELLCNTDFTAKSDVVSDLLGKAAQKLLADPGANVNEDAEIKAAITSVAQQTGENVQISRAQTLNAEAGGQVGSYLYAVTSKIAVLVSVSGKADDDLIRNLALHIVAQRPAGLNREDVPADLVAKEREIAIDQAKASGKPQNIAEKIAEGKMNAFFAERVLLDQEFVRPDVFKGSIRDLLKSKGATLHKYIRLETGVN